MEPFSTWREGLRLRGRPAGRPQIASDELRDNFYRDEGNVRQLVTPLKPWHERIVDYMLLNPNSKVVDLARAFSVTVPWMSMLLRTDSFREYYSQRMEKHRENVSLQIISKMQGVAVKAIDKMAEKLDTQDMPMSEVRETANMAVKALGYGATPGGVRVNVQTGKDGMVAVAVSSDTIAKAREAHARMRQENSKQIEHDPNEYRHVTAAMDVSPGEIEDAVVSDDYGTGDEPLENAS